MPPRKWKMDERLAAAEARGAEKQRAISGRNECTCYDPPTCSFWEGCPLCGGKGAFGAGEKYGRSKERESAAAEGLISISDHERLSAHAAAVAVEEELERAKRKLLEYATKAAVTATLHETKHSSAVISRLALVAEIKRICLAASRDFLPALGLPAAELLRRELGPLPAQRDPAAGVEEGQGEGAGPEQQAAQLGELGVGGEAEHQGTDQDEEQRNDDGEHVQQADAESVPRILPDLSFLRRGY